MRLIDADALEYDTEWSEYHDGFTAYSQMEIDTAPTIDAVSVVHGEWIVSYIDGIKQTECSACGKSFTTYDVYGWNYCPWCGAKMKGADDDKAVCRRGEIKDDII